MLLYFSYECLGPQCIHHEPVVFYQQLHALLAWSPGFVKVGLVAANCSNSEVSLCACGQSDPAMGRLLECMSANSEVLEGDRRHKIGKERKRKKSNCEIEGNHKVKKKKPHSERRDWKD